MKYTSPETRKIAITAVINQSLSPEEAAEVFGVNLSTIYRWVSTYKKNGRYEIRHSTGRPCKFTQEHKEKLRKLIEENNDRTLKELVELLDNVVQKSVISEQLIKMGYSYKKNSKGGRTKSS